jgi:hypothetical protein
MKIYWRLKDVPELGSLAPKERRLVHDLCLQQHYLHAKATRWSLLAYGAFLGSAILVGILGGDVVEWWSGWDSSWFTVGAMTVGGMLGWSLFNRIAIPRLRPFYGKFIRGET